MLPPPRPTLFPYTTLFRSVAAEIEVVIVDFQQAREAVRRLPEEAEPVAVVVDFARIAGVIAGDGVVEVIALVVPIAQPQSCRSEEHTSELQSRLQLVCRLL